ncbi:MAG: hypothetical protein U9Q95_03165 [Candidatus Eisenbacteria bacterium]|nr:hypothetical protein [Candidatus Eisenbacteria bacterium]
MRRLLLLIAVAFALLSGCTRAPHMVEPVGPLELVTLASAINAATSGAESYRGTGDGEIEVSGRTLKVAFAVVYERPGWLRADLRPAVGTMGASLTALALMEGECARLFFPARLLVVTGCISDVAGYSDWADPASLILGLPDASFLTEMSEVTASRRGGLLTLEGLVEDSRVRVKIDEDRTIITQIELGRDGTDAHLRVSYDGHGWKPGMSAPRTVELVAMEGKSREMRISIRYGTLREGESVERDAYGFEIPPGVLEIDWKDLNLWR